MKNDETDDVIDVLYAEWLMAQPEACICNGGMLIERIEQEWGFDDFCAQLPKQLRATLCAQEGGEGRVTDLEITKLCAEAMGLRHIVTPDKYVKGDTYVLLQDEGEWGIGPYDPLRDDAQAMALVKKFRIFINHSAPPGAEGYFKVAPHGQGITNCDDDLNRAICECVAKMQAEKPSGEGR